jgi:hypothetical protein
MNMRELRIYIHTSQIPHRTNGTKETDKQVHEEALLSMVGKIPPIWND